MKIKKFAPFLLLVTFLVSTVYTMEEKEKIKTKKEEILEYYEDLPEFLQEKIEEYKQIMEIAPVLFKQEPYISKAQLIKKLPGRGMTFIDEVFKEINNIRNEYVILRNSVQIPITVQIALDLNPEKSVLDISDSESITLEILKKHPKPIFIDTIPMKRWPLGIHIIQLPPQLKGKNFYLTVGEENTPSYYGTTIQANPGTIINLQEQKTKTRYQTLAIVRQIVIKNNLKQNILFENGLEKMIASGQSKDNVFKFNWKTNPNNKEILRIFDKDKKLIKSITVNDITPLDKKTTVIEVNPGDTEPSVKIFNTYHGTSWDL